MKKTLGNRKERTTNPTPAADPPAPKFIPRGTQNKTRILVTVTDGQIDFAAMGKEGAAAFNDLMHTPEVQAQFGFGPMRDRFDPKQCERIFQAIGLFFKSGARLLWKWHEESAAKLEYTKEEREELAEPTAGLLDELAPKWLRENQKLAALALVFSSITQAKLREAALLEQELKRKEKYGAAPLPSMPTPPAVIVGNGTQAAEGHCNHCNDARSVRMVESGQILPCPNCRPIDFAKAELAAKFPNRKPIPTSDSVNLGPAGGPDVKAN